MILAQNLHLFCSLCKLAYSLGTLRTKFDPTTNKVTLEKPQGQDTWKKYRYYLSTLLTAIVALQCFLMKNSAMMETIIAWSLLTFLLIGHNFVCEFRMKPDETQGLFNSLFHLNSLLPNKVETIKTTLPIRANLLVGYAMILSALLIPIGFAHGLHWLNPCKPTLAGYWLI